MDNVEVGQLGEVCGGLADQPGGLAGLQQPDLLQLLLHLRATILERQREKKGKISN